MTVFSFVRYGENLGTRQLGERVRTSLLDVINQGDKVVLDFNGVNVVSNSFADECLAKLLMFMTIDELKAKTTFSNINEMAKNCIVIAFKRRLKFIRQNGGWMPER